MNHVVIIGDSFAGQSHGLLGHDHKPPMIILAEAREQLARYPTIRPVDARADGVSGTIDDFSARTGDGASLRARRPILSYGVVDRMPDVTGFAENRGTSIVPCPCCDGPVIDGRIAEIARPRRPWRRRQGRYRHGGRGGRFVRTSAQ